MTVDHDGQVDIRSSDAVSDDFAQNQVRCRVEGRFGLSVNQPGAIVDDATAAALDHLARRVVTVADRLTSR